MKDAIISLRSKKRPACHRWILGAGYPLVKLTGWNILMFNRKCIFKGSILYCYAGYASLLECASLFQAGSLRFWREVFEISTKSCWLDQWIIGSNHFPDFLHELLCAAASGEILELLKSDNFSTMESQLSKHVSSHIDICDTCGVTNITSCPQNSPTPPKTNEWQWKKNTI